jgi:hypothetical protein
MLFQFSSYEPNINFWTGQAFYINTPLLKMEKSFDLAVRP